MGFKRGRTTRESLGLGLKWSDGARIQLAREVWLNMDNAKEYSLSPRKKGRWKKIAHRNQVFELILPYYAEPETALKTAYRLTPYPRKWPSGSHNVEFTAFILDKQIYRLCSPAEKL